MLADIASRGDAAMRRFDTECVASAAYATRAWLPPGSTLFVNITAATVAAAVDGRPLPGVEDPADLAALVPCDVRYVQGFALGRPERAPVDAAAGR